MKRNVLKLGLGVLSVLLFFSCLDEGKDIHVSYGVIQNVNSENNYEIQTDNGNTLIVTKSFTGQKVEDDKRVYVNFEILSDKDKNKNVYEIQVNGFYNLLSKPLVSESFILQNEEFRRDSIGNDPFSEISARFGGEYININFELYYKEGSDTKHMINLVYDDTHTNTDTLYLRLYHNAFGEVPGKGYYLFKGHGRSSFKISDIALKPTTHLLPTSNSSIPVKLTWLEYDNDLKPIERSGSSVFKYGDKSENGKSFEKAKGLDNYINTI